MIDTSRAVERTNGSSYCGPLVVAAILGTSTGTVESEIFALRRAGQSRKRARLGGVLRRTYEKELRAVLAAHGYRTETVDCGARLVRWRSNVFTNDSFTRWYGREPLFSAETLHPVSLLRPQYLSLWQWRCSRVIDRNATYVVNTPGHWALYSAGKWCETYTRGEWVDARVAPGSRRRVISTHLVTRG